MATDKENGMEKKTIFEIMNANPAVHLATVEDGEPRVRVVFLYSAGEDGIVFHVGKYKEVYRQIAANPAVELCFNDSARGVQVRVRGKLEEITDHAFKDKIVNTPGREFLKKWRDSGEIADFYDTVRVFALRHGRAHAWSMDKNFAPKEWITL